MSIVAIAEGLYNPSIDDLKVINLELRLEAMLEANKNFNKSDATLKMASLERNALFNTKRNGLVYVCLLAKKRSQIHLRSHMPEELHD